MRHLRRLGILAAATTLAGTTALAGAGMAGAQASVDWTTDSPSSVSIERDGDGDLVVSYDNNSGEGLLCYAYIGPRGMVEELYDLHVEAGLVDNLQQLPEGAEAVIVPAAEDGQWAVGAYFAAEGSAGPVEFGVYEYDEVEDEAVWVPTPLEQPEDRTFPAEVVTACAYAEDPEQWYTYAELEMSVTSGDGPGDGPGDGNGGGLFGSLADLIPALGS